MRNLLTLVFGVMLTHLCAASVYDVPANGLLRLPVDVRVIDRLQVSDGGKLLIPAAITGLKINQLTMGVNARISIAPRDATFELAVGEVDLADGSVIAALGAYGDIGVPGGSGSSIKLVFKSGSVNNLVVDTRGGNGGKGWTGAQGRDGSGAACWGRGSSQGAAGGNGSDGLPGGDGGNIELVLDQPQWLEVIDIMQSGGKGGAAGDAGAGGKGGQSADCWVYSLGDGSRDGQVGNPGRASVDGRPGILRVN